MSASNSAKLSNIARKHTRNDGRGLYGSKQVSLFDAQESSRRKHAGMARAAAGKNRWLEEARRIAVQVALRDGVVNADTLRAEGVTTPPGASPNVWGGVFNDDRFVFDQYVHSTRPEAHSNLIRSWRLRA